MDKTPLLSIQNLSVEILKGKNIFPAVDEISFDLYPGEICGIVGESGCGKSLTALSVAGLLPQAARARGSVLFLSGESASRNLLELNEKEFCSIRGREISMIFQESVSSLNPLMKIGPQIAESLEIHQGKKDRKKNKKENLRKALDLMEKLGLENPERLAETYPWRLSGGMCQRVMIAMAMICGPRLLIADEPTTALDQDNQEQILTLLEKINDASGAAVLFISHDLGIVNRLCDRVVVMYAGKIVEQGNTGEVFSTPGHEYTRSLLGALPERNRKGEKLRVIPGKVPSIEARATGCPFTPRCALAEDQCRTVFPGEVKLSETHTSRCVNALPKERL